MSGRDYRLGRVNLTDRAATIPLPKDKPRKDTRSDQEYADALANETEASLMRSPNWRAGRPLDQAERWPTLHSGDLGGTVRGRSATTPNPQGRVV